MGSGQAAHRSEGDDLLILYVRTGCHLCVEAEDLIVPLLPEGRFRLQVFPIDRDAAAVARYGLRVPVLVRGGRELCWGRLELRGLRAALGLPDISEQPTGMLSAMWAKLWRALVRIISQT